LNVGFKIRFEVSAFLVKFMDELCFSYGWAAGKLRRRCVGDALDSAGSGAAAAWLYGLCFLFAVKILVFLG